MFKPIMTHTLYREAELAANIKILCRSFGHKSETDWAGETALKCGSVPSITLSLRAHGEERRMICT
jgi:hypothetical protein